MPRNLRNSLSLLITNNLLRGQAGVVCSRVRHALALEELEAAVQAQLK
jgi:hypothetical protein